MRAFGSNIRVDGFVLIPGISSDLCAGYRGGSCTLTTPSTLAIDTPSRYGSLFSFRLAQLYEQQTITVLSQITRSESGRCLIQQIHNSSNTITIIPPRNRATYNACAGSTSYSEHLGLLDGSVRSARVMRSGTRIERIEGSVCLPNPQYVIRGTGLGGDSYVEYNSEIFSRSMATYPGETSYEVLFHELVHALRQLKGISDLQCTARDIVEDNFDNFDEFCAILGANIYASENNRPLRANHRIHGTILSLNERDFMDRYLTLIGQFHIDLEEFAQQLARINCSFNPLRRYLGLR